ncbi:Rv3235 family protein [Arthrobacter crystallopoietes]|uniref:Uncharacterized protein n=1 Tax=Crystallibacter crystallopoietes TaxID=37928 RepID=A0A1H1FH73_9MICC|nr:Rv3235 family protein [Arthrobacter crystallopoietes]SDR00210.1 hypothetical protein SAMN04489742_3446 [Arthrobacter crystallopoietes]
MNNVTPLRQDKPEHADRELTEVQALAPASGAPRPLTVRPVRSPDPEDYFAPVVRLQPRTPSKTPDKAGDRAPGGPAGEQTRGMDAQELRQVTATARSVAQAAMEAIGGTRPVQQLARWLDPVCYEKVARRAGLVRERQERRAAAGQTVLRLHRSATIRSSRVCQVSDSAYEASLVIAEASRVRAVALRLEFRRGLWKVAALEIG